MIDSTDEMTLNIDLVRHLLAKRGWTPAELARQMDMSKSTVSRVMSRQKQPGRVFIARMRRVFPEQRDALFVEPTPPTPLHREVSVTSSVGVASGPGGDAA